MSSLPQQARGGTKPVIQLKIVD